MASSARTAPSPSDLSAPIPARLQTWPTHEVLLDALPHPAAIVTQHDARLAVIGCNDSFASIGGHDAVFADDSPINRACCTVLTGSNGRVSLLWEQGGFSGRVFEATAAPVPLAHARPGVLLSLVDRTTLTRSEANLRRELLTDSLTGMPNRSGFSDMVEQRLRTALEPGTSHTLLVVDLRRFSRINESIGALAGDELLLTVAKRLVQQCRSGDILARIGGNEFAILGVTKGGGAGARRLARRIRQAFDHPFRVGTMLINIDCAIGGIDRLGASGNGLDQDGPELIRQALIALKQAKNRDGIAFYAPTSLSVLHHRFDRETALRAAIEHDSIDLMFQPLVDMKRRRVVGFEALARWTLDGQSISPAEFVPIAEDSGLIVPLGRQVLTKALGTLAKWDAQLGRTMPVSMSVNVSPIQLARDDIVSVVKAALEQTGIDGHRLVVEMTESSVVESASSAEAILRALSSRGVRIAMDDFGTGFSNIAGLQRLPIDTLKIDRSLVVGIDTSADSLAIVRTIQRLAEALGLRTTAEGIETETVAQQIAAIGCTTGQGYLFSKPLNADAAFAAWQAAQLR